MAGQAGSCLLALSKDAGEFVLSIPDAVEGGHLTGELSTPFCSTGLLKLFAWLEPVLWGSAVYVPEG